MEANGGLKINAAIPWTMVVAAAVAAIVMYRDVQDMKANMIKAERIAKVEADIAYMKDDLREKVTKAEQSHQAIWQAIQRKEDKQ